MAERASKIDISTVTLANLMAAKYRLGSAADEMYAGAYLRASEAGGMLLLDNAAENIAEALDALGLVAVPKAEAAADPLRDDAPDLLAALEALDDFWTANVPAGPDGGGEINEFSRLADDTLAIWKQARAAIAKAKGGEG